MQGYPGMNMNRPGLGLRPPMPSYGQGPSMMTLAQRQQAPPPGRPSQDGITLFVGSIAGGITDAFLQQLLSVRVILLNHHAMRDGWTNWVNAWIDMWHANGFQTSHHTREQTSRIRVRDIRWARGRSACSQASRWRGTTWNGGGRL